MREGRGLPLIGFLDASLHLYKRVCPSVGRSVRPSVTRYFLMMRKWPKWCNKLGNVLVTLSNASLGNSRQLWATLGQLLGNSGTHLWANSWPCSSMGASALRFFPYSTCISISGMLARLEAGRVREEEAVSVTTYWLYLVYYR